MSRKIRILSIDGGGVRGVIPLTVLNHIEAVSGKKICELFDYIIGTSTGGIIGIMLASGIDLKDINEFYYGENCKKIFTAKFFRNPLKFKYPSEAIEGILHSLLGDRKLSEVKIPCSTTFYDTLSNESKIITSSNEIAKEVMAWQCARATSAAPSYFEPFPFHGMVAIDGGMFANNPTLCGYIEAKKLFGSDCEFSIASIGTGICINPIPFDKIRNFSILDWGVNLFNITSDGESDTVDYSMGKLDEVKSYYRFGTKLPKENSSVDDASDRNLHELERIADVLIKTSWRYDLDNLIKDLMS